MPDKLLAAHHSENRSSKEVTDQTLEIAARIVKALGDSARQRRLTIRSKGEVCMSELITQGQLSTVCQWLRTLRTANARVNTPITALPTNQYSPYHPQRLDSCR